MVTRRFTRRRVAGAGQRREGDEAKDEPGGSQRDPEEHKAQKRPDEVVLFVEKGQARELQHERHASAKV